MGSSDKRIVIQMGEDGLPLDDVHHYPATAEHLDSYRKAEEALSRFKQPALLDLKDPHSHLIVGALDGTRNDVAQDPLHATNVAKFHEQIWDAKFNGVDRIHVEYKEGPGTQKNFFANKADSALGHTGLERAEQMYKQIVDKANEIYDADPHAKIAVHIEAFSRGSVEAPLVARMIHERGIPVRGGRDAILHEHGQSFDSPLRYIQAPGRTPMSVGLYDPVPTGVMQLYDLRLPPSVVTGFQIDALHEKRGTFPVLNTFPKGLSEDGRFLRVEVAGVHSNIGGGYLRSGLSDRSFNLMAGFHNGLVSEPIFQKLHETDDPRMNVLHHSEEGNPVFRLTPKAHRDVPAGHVMALTPDYAHVAAPGQVVHVAVQQAEPLSKEMAHVAERARVAELGSRLPPTEIPAGDALNARLLAENVMLKPPLSTGAQVMRGAGVVGAAASFIEAKATAEKVGGYWERDNPLAAHAELQHYVARGAGGWIGGAVTGFAAGWETGPGVIAFVVVGAVAGSSVGERVATWWDDKKIYRQTDRDGIAWEYKGRAWVREQLADTTRDHTDNPTKIQVTASYEKSRELDFMATNTATLLAVRELPGPRDPYRVPASKEDPSSLGNPAPWVRDARSGDWQREVVVGHVDRGRPLMDRQTASPERAMALDKEAETILRANIANSEAALAARYQAACQMHGFAEFGPMLEPMRDALSGADRLLASDGKWYQFDASGDWMHEGKRAEGNTMHELDASRALLQTGLAMHAEEMKALPSFAARTPEQMAHDQLMYQYRLHDTELKPDWLAAIQLASERTRQEYGLDSGTVTLLPNVEGKNRVIRADSAIQHSQVDSDGISRVVAVTTTEQIRAALQEVRLAGVPHSSPSLADQHGRVAAPAHDSNAPASSDKATHSPLIQDMPTVTVTAPRSQAQERDDPTSERQVQESQEWQQWQQERQQQQWQQLQREEQRHTTAIQTATEQKEAAQATLGSGLPLSDPDHPAHEHYENARQGVVRVYSHQKQALDDHVEPMAASLVVQAQRDALSHINDVTLSADGQHLVASNTHDASAAHRETVQVGVAQAMGQSVADSSQQWARQHITQAQEQLHTHTQALAQVQERMRAPEYAHARTLAHAPEPQAAAPAMASAIDVQAQQALQQSQQALQQGQLLQQQQHNAQMERQRQDERREAREQEAQPPSVPPVAAHLRDFRHAGHPRHEAYERFMQGLEKAQAGFLQGSNLGRYSPEQHERLAAAFTAVQGMQPCFSEVGRFHQDKDGALWAGELPSSMHEPQRWLKIDLAQTLAHTPEAIADAWREHNIPAPTPHLTTATDPLSLSPDDMRHPQHPRHAMYEQVHSQLGQAYEKWGMPQDPAQLERQAACCVVAARSKRLEEVGGLLFGFPNGRVDQPLAYMQQDPAVLFGKSAEVSPQQLAQAPEVSQASVQLQQVEQQVALVQQQEMQQRQEREMAQGQGRSM